MYKEAFNRLPEYFRKPNTEKAYYIGYGSTSDLLQASTDVRESRDIDNAYGHTLDLIGGNVGQARLPGMQDDEYRLRIKVAIVANLSDGDIPTINEVAESLFKEQYLGLHEIWDKSKDFYEPSAVVLHLKAPTDLRDGTTINKVVAGGVAIYWTLTFQQSTPSIYMGAMTASGESITIYPRVPQDITTNPQIYMGASYNSIEETVLVNGLYKNKAIIFALNLENYNYIASQKESIELHSEGLGDV